MPDTQPPGETVQSKMSADRHPLREAVEEYLSALGSERGLARNTVAAYRRDLSSYLEWLASVAIERPSPDSVSRYVAALHDNDMAPTTVARKVAALRGFHRFMVSEEFATDDPTVLLESPRRGERLPKALDIHEVTALVEAPSGDDPLAFRDRAILEFLYATGARVSECTALDTFDIDFETATVILTGKGDKQRLVPIGQPAIRALSDWLTQRRIVVGERRDDGALFLNNRGKRLSRQGVWGIVRKYGTIAGIKADRLSPHVLRHSVATHMVEGGADLRSVQDLLGHASISTTQVYTRVSPRHVFEVYVSSHPRSR